MKFTAKWAAYNLAVAEPEVEYYRDGRERQIRPAIIVDFGEQALGAETYERFDGDPSFAQLRGGGYYLFLRWRDCVPAGGRFARPQLLRPLREHRDLHERVVTRVAP
jgi:hypothetical protein